MYEYNFVGRIIPERVNYEFAIDRPFLFPINESWKVTVSLSIKRSEVFVKCTSNIEVTDFGILRSAIEDFIRLFTDSFGYIRGYGYDVSIDYVSYGEPLKQHLFSIGIKDIENERKNRPVDTTSQLVNLLMKSKSNQLKESLKNLRLSIKYSSDTGVYCYRAIESIMQHFNTNGDRKKAWLDVRDKLHVSEEGLSQ